VEETVDDEGEKSRQWRRAPLDHRIIHAFFCTLRRIETQNPERAR
jgi:hypothetical protein